MIRINVIIKNDNYKQITFKGHADYNDYGKDIVCAATSATYLCTVNAILSINSDAIKVTQAENINIIDIIKNDEITKKLLDNMLECLKSIEKNYPKNIKIKSKEE